MIWRYRFSPEDGHIKEQSEHYSGHGFGFPDGSAIDVDGYLWNARYGAACIAKIDPEGKLVEEIALPVTNPTSCCFGGENNSILYVTSARAALSKEVLGKNPYEGSVIAIQTDTKGADANIWHNNKNFA